MMPDAKALLSLCPQGFDADAATTSSSMETKAEELRLRKMIDDAETLESQSSAALEQCTALLQKMNCYLHKEELRASLRCLATHHAPYTSSPTSRKGLRLRLLGLPFYYLLRF